MIHLDLPDRPIPDRVSLTRWLDAGERTDYAALDGPGCIRHIWMTPTRTELANRQIIIRIYFDDEPVPYVEAPIGDFFGVMHGKKFYPVNTEYLSVKSESGYNCYFPMPFAKSARIELEAGPQGNQVFIMVDWHRYPGCRMSEPMRFCSRWRREMPTQRYGEDFTMLDADGPGRLIGFVYGVRLFDNADRWSHGGSNNIYIDGTGEHPAFLRGIGGEDDFGTSYGGALHTPETHLYSAIPYYVHDDIGEARPAQRLVGYRFFEHDAIHFDASLHMRFGCMRNDICSTSYWYQSRPVRPFFNLPDWPLLLPGAALPRDTCDIEAPSTGEWWCCGPFGLSGMDVELPPEVVFDPAAEYDAMHEEGSGWLSEGSRELKRNTAKWVRRKEAAGFIDFNHFYRAWIRGSARTHPGVAIARSIIDSPSETTAHLRIAWDDTLRLRLNDYVYDLGTNHAFRSKTLEVPLKKGANILLLKLSNTINSNHGGWAFSFQARLPDGTVLQPRVQER